MNNDTQKALGALKAWMGLHPASDDDLDIFTHNHYEILCKALPAQEEEDGWLPCVSCGNPSNTCTPDDADMCWRCYGGFNAACYDELRDAAQAVIDKWDNPQWVISGADINALRKVLPQPPI